MNSSGVDLIVLTYNEELNLAHCLRSVQGLVQNIFIVDSGSTDRTVELACQYGAQIVIHPFKNQAEQFNWALENLPIQSKWILRLDADEYLSPELRDEIGEILPTLPSSITGIYLRRRLIFLNRWIRHGAYYPIWLLRIFRPGKAQSELSEMDEHIVLLEGESMQLKHDFSDHNRKGLSAWTIKHESYASRQARTLLRLQQQVGSEGVKPRLSGIQAERKRWLKRNFYGRIPLFARAFFYFIYRYFLRLGFLDKVPGLIFHFLHAGWYFFYVDAKLYEASIESLRQPVGNSVSKENTDGSDNQGQPLPKVVTR